MIALLTAAAVMASATSHDVPRLLERQIDRANAREAPAVLLPNRLRVDVERLYPSGRSGARRYALYLSAIRGCGGAGACFVAGFYAERRGERFPGGRRIRLARGRVGRYWPMQCGASCAEPQIQWRERGALYTFQAAVRGRRAMKRLANQAIRSGPRK